MSHVTKPDATCDLRPRYTWHQGNSAARIAQTRPKGNAAQILQISGLTERQKITKSEPQENHVFAPEKPHFGPFSRMRHEEWLGTMQSEIITKEIPTSTFGMPPCQALRHRRFHRRHPSLTHRGNTGPLPTKPSQDTNGEGMCCHRHGKRGYDTPVLPRTFPSTMRHTCLKPQKNRRTRPETPSRTTFFEDFLRIIVKLC